jgi:serine/threonine-protein kinase HipA
MVRSLDIELDGRPVGVVTNFASDANVFTFDAAYAADTNRPVLSLGYLDADRGLLDTTRPTRTKLPPFFANLLPEGHLRTYLAERARVNAIRDFPLLELLGNDLPGAVTARPRVAEVDERDGEGSGDVSAKGAGRDAHVLKFSLAGVQLKFSAIRETAGGLTIPASGAGGEWIVKMPSATYASVPENEYTMLSFARRVGIEVPDIGLVDSADIRNLPTGVRNDLGHAMYIRRFDREGKQRIHIEDFAQIFRQFPSDKYRNVSYGNMLAGIYRTLGEEQAHEFVRRLVFSIGIGNADMHLKNWSVIYRDGRTPTLAPAYDYVSTIAYIPEDALALTIARTKTWEDVSDDLLERFARRAGVPRGTVLHPARDMVERMHDAFGGLDAEGRLPPDVVDTIERHMARIPLFSGRRARAIRTSAVAVDDTLEPREIA